MNNQRDDQQQKPEQKRKNQIIFAISSVAALVIVGAIGFFTLSKIRSQKSTDVMSQDQFEGDVQISSQLQAECQSSVVKLSKMQDSAAMEAEYKQNADNCKDVYFTLENNKSIFRKEGVYADLVVDIAKEISKTDKAKAIELLKFAHDDVKAWDFYLGPTSCDSQQVLEAYIESFSDTEQKTCFSAADVPTKVVPELTKKNFAVLASMAPAQDVTWLASPESDSGCPEKVSSIIQVIKKLTTGSVTVDSSPTENSEHPEVNINIKLSDKENISIVAQGDQQGCLKLSTVLVPTPEASE